MACNVLEIHPCDRHVHPGTCTAWRQRTINFIFKGCRFYDVRVVCDGGKRKTLNWFWCKRSPFTYLLMEVKVKSTIDNGYICESISLFCRQSVQRTKGQGKQGAFVNQAHSVNPICVLSHPFMRSLAICSLHHVLPPYPLITRPSPPSQRARHIAQLLFHSRSPSFFCSSLGDPYPLPPLPFPSS